MNFFSKTFLFFLLTLTSVMCAGVANADVVVVVSSASTVEELDRIQIENLFLGRSNRFPNGKLAVPIDQEEGSPMRQAFYLSLSGMTSSQIKSHWSRAIFTGRGRPPRTISNADELITALMNNPNAIGYIDESLVDSRLKIVFRPTSVSQTSLASESLYLSRSRITTMGSRDNELASWK